MIQLAWRLQAMEQPRESQHPVNEALGPLVRSCLCSYRVNPKRLKPLTICLDHHNRDSTQLRSTPCPVRYH